MQFSLKHKNSIDMLADSITQQGSSNDFASSLTAGAGAGTDPAASVSSLNSQEISKKNYTISFFIK